MAHRGPQPGDNDLFSPERLPQLRQSVADLSWLLTRGYSVNGALKMVGDRYQLTSRQRLAVGRSSCADQAREQRLRHQLSPAECRHRRLHIDGFNLLITLESALAGGFLFIGRDEAIRDLAGVHGMWRRVDETERALRLVGDALLTLGNPETVWLFDTPVSNSGRLCGLLASIAAERHLAWTAEMVMNPDRRLESVAGVVVSSDSVVLDRASAWVNLTAELLPSLKAARVVQLGSVSDDAGSLC